MAEGTINRQSFEAQATELLRRRIIEGELPLGSRLIEASLAEDYELSRGTIRAALRRLVNEGLVHQVPYAGYRVVDFSEHDFWEIYTLRATLEGLGARLAAENIEPDGANELRALFEQLMQAATSDDHTESNRLDHQLHLAIIRLANHERLAQHYASIENQFRAYIALTNRDVGSYEIGESHRDLVESICAGHGNEARRLAEANIAPPTGAHNPLQEDSA